MLICYGRPVTTWTLGGTWSPAFLLDGASVSTAANLSDGDPQIPARFLWRNTAPAITDYADLIGTYASAITVGFVAVLGTNLPVGTYVEARDATTLLGAGYVIETPRGERRVCFKLAVPTVTASLRVRIYNKNSVPATVLTASQQIDIGEIWFGQVSTVDAQPGFSVDWVSPEVTSRSVVNSIVADTALSYRRLSFIPIPRTAEATFNDTADFEVLVARCDRGQFSVVVPVTDTVSEVNRTAQFGKLMNGTGFAHNSVRWFNPGAWTHEESPSPPA